MGYYDADIYEYSTHDDSDELRFSDFYGYDERELKRKLDSCQYSFQIIYKILYGHKNYDEQLLEEELEELRTSLKLEEIEAQLVIEKKKSTWMMDALKDHMTQLSQIV